MKPLPSQEKWKELFDLYSKAEETLKSSEWITLELSTPALNQLRYTGYHILHALQSEPINEEELIKAIGHAKRAYFDAKEIIALHSIETIRKIRDEVKGHSDVLKGQIRDYPTVRDNMICAQKSINELIFKKESRDDLYQNLDKPIKTLQIYIESYECAREDIFAEIYKKKTVKFWQIIGGMGAIATIIGIIKEFFI